MAHVLSRLFLDRGALRATLALSSYATVLYCVAVALCLWPQLTFAATGYSRIMTATQFHTMMLARQAAQAGAAAQAIALANPGTSIAVRTITAATGWPGLAIAAGLVLAQMHLDAQQVQDIKAASATPGAPDIEGYPEPGGAEIRQCPGAPECMTNWVEYLTVPTPTPGGIGCKLAMVGDPPAGWNGWYSAQAPQTCLAFRYPWNPNPSQQSEPQPATAQDIQDYWNENPTGPNSPASNTSPVGSGQSATDASTVINDPVTPSDAPTTVVPSNQVPDDSVMIDPNATPPAGTQTTSTTTQQTTTTTTTTTNPDGSTTTQDDSSTTVQCSTGDHELRSFGAILEEHMTAWRGSGIAGQLALLQSLTWPSDLPTITWTSMQFGTFAVNFNDWSTMFLALRAIVIAGAGFAAYRIIFVGNG
ncbi:MAG: hypothetical protein NDI90_08100 [Nitrospira sp. BO4]|jgi:hypothetical protein|nr:hypothetical protein [Nitrospira sp. BO4]